MFGLANSLLWLFVGRIISGIAGGVVATAQAYIVDISSPEDRTKNFGLVGAAFGLGFIMGPTLGGMLSKVSLATPLYVACTLSLCNALLAYFNLPESLSVQKRQAIEVKAFNPLSQLGQLFQNAKIRPLLLGFMLFNFGFAGFQSNFATFNRDQFHWGTEQNAWLFAYIGLVSSAVQGGLIRQLLPHFGEQQLAIVGLVLTSLGTGGVAFVPSGAWLYLCSTLIALGVGLCMPTLRGLISKGVSQQEQGRTLGGMQALASLGLVLGPLWAGLVFDHIGYSAPYWTCGFWIGVGLLLAIPALSTPRPSLNPRP
jgi:MFS family permease